jgi:hypothetical protein
MEIIYLSDRKDSSFSARRFSDVKYSLCYTENV